MKWLLATVALVLATSAQADLSISTGSKTGTYAAFAKDIQSVCEDRVRLNLYESTGSDQNLFRLEKKEKPAADLAFVQLDTLSYAAMTDPEDASDSDIKALFVLYPEEVHVIALSKLKVGGHLGFFGEAPKDVTQLAGKRVGAWGGSFTTAKVINAQTLLGIDVVKLNNQKEGLAALNDGQVAALIYVAGQPDSFISGLNRDEYTLLEVPQAISAKASFYAPARLNYPQFGTVPSISVKSLLVTRNFRTAEKKQEISTLKQCVIDHLDELKEGDFHPKWKFVDPKAASTRSYYETVSVPSQAKK